MLPPAVEDHGDLPFLASVSPFIARGVGGFVITAM